MQSSLVKVEGRDTSSHCAIADKKNYTPCIAQTVHNAGL